MAILSYKLSKNDKALEYLKKANEILSKFNDDSFQTLINLFLENHSQISSTNFHKSLLFFNRICDHCGISLISSSFYCCTICPDFDLCQQCYLNNQSISVSSEINSQPHQSNHPLIHIDLKDKSFKQRLILEQSIQQMSMEDFVNALLWKNGLVWSSVWSKNFKLDLIDELD